MPSMHDAYGVHLPEHEARELQGHLDTMRSTAPSSEKAKANARIKALVAKAEAIRARASGIPVQGGEDV